ARVLTLRLCRSFFLDLGHDDVRPEVLVDDLSSGERTFREELVVDFDSARFLHTFAGRLFLLHLFRAFVGFLSTPADSHRLRMRRRRAHRTPRTTRTRSC